MKISAIKIAQNNGAKLHRNASLKAWVVLDQPQGSRLWIDSFPSKRAAALAFIHEHHLSQQLYH